MRTSCEPAPYYPVGLISGPPVARFAELVRDGCGMTGFPIPLPITGKYATFNKKYAQAVRNRRCWVWSNWKSRSRTVFWCGDLLSALGAQPPGRGRSPVRRAWPPHWPPATPLGLTPEWQPEYCAICARSVAQSVLMIGLPSIPSGELASRV